MPATSVGTAMMAAQAVMRFTELVDRDVRDPDAARVHGADNHGACIRQGCRIAHGVSLPRVRHCGLTHNRRPHTLASCSGAWPLSLLSPCCRCPRRRRCCTCTHPPGTSTPSIAMAPPRTAMRRSCTTTISTRLRKGTARRSSPATPPTTSCRWRSAARGLSGRTCHFLECSIPGCWRPRSPQPWRSLHRTCERTVHLASPMHRFEPRP